MVGVSVSQENLASVGNITRLQSLDWFGLGITGEIRVNEEYLTAGVNLETGGTQPFEFHMSLIINALQDISLSFI
jgi:hypothetical protein